MTFFSSTRTREYLRYCQKQIETFLTGLRLELNEKTNIFPSETRGRLLGFHTYITESGQIIRKLRHSSVKRMKGENQEVEEGLPDRQGHQARSWIAGPPGTLMRPMATPTHPAGDRCRSREIIGTQLRCHAPIRLSKTQKAMLEYKKRLKASKQAASQAADEHHAASAPW